MYNLRIGAKNLDLRRVVSGTSRAFLDWNAVDLFSPEFDARKIMKTKCVQVSITAEAVAADDFWMMTDHCHERTRNSLRG